MELGGFSMESWPAFLALCAVAYWGVEVLSQAKQLVSRLDALRDELDTISKAVSLMEGSVDELRVMMKRNNRVD